MRLKKWRVEFELPLRCSRRGPGQGFRRIPWANLQMWGSSRQGLQCQRNYWTKSTTTISTHYLLQRIAEQEPFQTQKTSFNSQRPRKRRRRRFRNGVSVNTWHFHSTLLRHPMAQFNPAELSPNDRRTHESGAIQGERYCDIDKAALQERGVFLPRSYGSQAPTFVPPRLGPADLYWFLLRRIPLPKLHVNLKLEMYRSMFWEVVVVGFWHSSE